MMNRSEHTCDEAFAMANSEGSRNLSRAFVYEDNAEKYVGIAEKGKVASDLRRLSDTTESESTLSKGDVPRSVTLHTDPENDSDQASISTFGSMLPEELQKQLKEQQEKLQSIEKKGGKKGSNGGFDCRICTVALCVCVIIGGAIAGAVVAFVLSPLKTPTEPTHTDVPSTLLLTFPTASPSPSALPPVSDVSPADSTTSLPLHCTSPTLQLFPQTAAMSLYLQVSESIAEADLNYVARVLQGSYNSLMTSKSNCDMSCQDITAATVSSSLFVSNVPSSTSEDVEKQEVLEDSRCKQTLKVTFAVEGTYWGCDNDRFAGLVQEEADQTIDSNGNNDNIFDTRKLMLRRRRQLEAKPTTHICTCIEEADTTAHAGPTAIQLADAMEPLLVVLPDICGIELIQG